MDPTQEQPSQTDFQEIPQPIEDTSSQPTEQPQAFCDTREGKLLSELIDNLERPDETTRETMVRMWKKMENYWRDRQYIIWDEMVGDWRTPEEIKDDHSSIDIDPAAYAKIVNVYKAHGEAIISALSAGLPYVKFFPDDADSQDDIFTAKSYSKISELIQKRNKGQLLFIRALFILYNCGTTFAYNENRETDQFGTISTPQYQDANVVTRHHFCPSCGMMLGSQQYDAPQAPPQSLMGQAPQPPAPQPPQAPPQMGAQPGGMPMGGQSVQGANSLPAPAPQTCPQCTQDIQPDYEDFEEVIPRLTGYTEEPKSHECIEIFSGLSVKVPHWITDQSQTPYLSLETEEHFALLKSVFPEVADKIAPSPGDDSYARMARRNSDYQGDTPRDLCTLKRSWIRPWAFNQLGNEEDVQYLLGLYPEGCYLVKIDDMTVEAVPDRLDDHWTITLNPLSNHVHADPLAQPLVPVQDIQNELTNLTLETIEFGIPETFYDSEAIDGGEYGKSEARPGMLYPAKARVGMGLDSSFYTVKTSALSQEVDTFSQRMTTAGQFVSGAFPTIWGGALEGGGGTAKEYEQSRAMALQRLNLTWTLVKIWWSDVMAKAVRSFAINMKDDERYVQAKGSTFINVWIRQAEMQGKVGQVEPEVNESFPISWAQKRDIIMQLIGMKDPMISSVIAHPENAGMVAGIVGFPELYIPGDDARNKQLYEIAILIQAAPHPAGIPDPANPGQEAMQSTVQVQKWEEHGVEADTCKAWLMSEVGIDAKQNNPGGYMNVVAHMQMHQLQAALMAPPPMAPAPPQKGQAPVRNEGKPNVGQPPQINHGPATVSS